MFVNHSPRGLLSFHPLSVGSSRHPFSQVFSKVLCNERLESCCMKDKILTFPFLLFFDSGVDANSESSLS